MGCQKWTIYHYFKLDGKLCTEAWKKICFLHENQHNVVISPGTGMKFQRKMHHQVENMLVPFSEVNFILKFKQIKIKFNF